MENLRMLGPEPTDGSADQPTDQPTDGPTEGVWTPTVTMVVAEQATVVGPADLDQPPVIAANPAAIAAYAAVADEDVVDPGFDAHSPSPMQPSAHLVGESALTPLVRLGERFQAFYTRYTTGRLGRVVPATVTTWQVLKGLLHYLLIGVVVVGSAITLEVVYGSAAADLLARDDHVVSLRAAIAATLVLNGGGWIFADLAYRHAPHLARQRGLWIALVGFGGITVVVTCLGLVIGGWDPLQVSTVSGGGTNSAAVPEADHRWLLAGTYITLVVLATLVTAAGHYLVLDTFQERFVRLTKTREHRARAASLTPEQQDDLAARLARAYLDTVPTAEQHIRLRLEAYNAAFARGTSPELNDMVTPLTYTPVTPLWAAQAHQLARGPALSTQVRRETA